MASLSLSLLPMFMLGLVVFCVTVLFISALPRSFKLRHSPKSKNTPPIIYISEHELFRNPRQAYERALALHGPVIGVKRKGRLEYIVNEHFSHDVLTNNRHFSFEQGTSFILNLHYFHRFFTAFYAEIDDLVRNVIVSRMPLVVEQVFPCFMRVAGEFQEELAPGRGQDLRYIDAEIIAHRGISEAMAHVILGEQFVTADNLKVIERVAHDMATVTGIHQNTSWWGTNFPGLWRAFTWARVLTTTIPVYYRTIGWQIWTNLRKEICISEEAKENPELFKGSVLSYLARKNVGDDGRVGFFAFVKISALVLGIVFASVHQTASVAVWMLYELASRPEYLAELREEMNEVAKIDATSPDISYDALQKATRLDSFIREVMRTKGDTLSTCRMSTDEVPLAGYTIPKGFLVFPLASLSHLNKSYHGADAETFDGRRWVESGKQAVMVNHTYFPFGLGRWACPGRNLAVAEIKMIIWSVICRSTPVLFGGSYSVPDPLNVTSVAPEGTMSMLPLSF